MLVRMSVEEVRQAIREWFDRRGVDCSKNEIVFSYKPNEAHQIVTKGALITDIEGVSLEVEKPPKDGPFR